MADIKLYTLDEVAEIMKLTKRTLYSYIKEGRLHAIKFGKYWRVPENNLKEFISKGAPLTDVNRLIENQNKKQIFDLTEND